MIDSESESSSVCFKEATYSPPIRDFDQIVDEYRQDQLSDWSTVLMPGCQQWSAEQVELFFTQIFEGLTVYDEFNKPVCRSKRFNFFIEQDTGARKKISLGSGGNYNPPLPDFFLWGTPKIVKSSLAPDSEFTEFEYLWFSDINGGENAYRSQKRPGLCFNQCTDHVKQFSGSAQWKSWAKEKNLNLSTLNPPQQCLGIYEMLTSIVAYHQKMDQLKTIKIAEDATTWTQCSPIIKLMNFVFPGKRVVRSNFYMTPSELFDCGWL